MRIEVVHRPNAIFEETFLVNQENGYGELRNWDSFGRRILNTSREDLRVLTETPRI